MPKPTFKDVVRSFEAGRFYPRCNHCKNVLMGRRVRIDYINEVFLCDRGCASAESNQSRAPKSLRVMPSPKRR